MITDDEALQSKIQNPKSKIGPWVTFDCFGTLVDWHTGFTSALRQLFGSRTAEVLRAYHKFESQLEAEQPYRLYRDVLTEALSLAATEAGVPISADQARALPESWASLPIFPDVEEMLHELRALGCHLGVLTNCDDELFEMTQGNFRRPFDLVVTAQQVHAYKPALAHFHSFAHSTGVGLKDWVHVACSWYHDIAPARTLGLPRIWLDRDHTGDDVRAASIRVHSASEVCPAVQELFRG